MAIINPYLNFAGNTEEAFNFYKSVFGGEFIVFQRYKDMPKDANQEAQEGASQSQQITAKDAEKVLHVALPVGKSNILMGSDCPESMAKSIIMGTNVSLSLNTDSEEETERLFKALSEDGVVKMPLAKTFWNAYFGMCTDKFGINWMVNFDYGQVK